MTDDTVDLDNLQSDREKRIARAAWEEGAQYMREVYVLNPLPVKSTEAKSRWPIKVRRLREVKGADGRVYRARIRAEGVGVERRSQCTDKWAALFCYPADVAAANLPGNPWEEVEE